MQKRFAMPRYARLYLPGFPYHVVQRGNNREACFIEPENYQFYLVLWEELSSRYDLAVHTYCLMTNHVHFLLTPNKESAVSKILWGQRQYPDSLSGPIEEI